MQITLTAYGNPWTAVLISLGTQHCWFANWPVFEVCARLRCVSAINIVTSTVVSWVPSGGFCKQGAMNRSLRRRTASCQLHRTAN